MKKWILSGCVSLLTLLAAPAFAADVVAWSGEVFGIVSKNANVTQEYCTSHSPDMFDANADTIYTQVTAKNGVQSKNISRKAKDMGGIYMIKGVAMFNGTYEDKPWQEKVYYYGTALQDKGGLEQGVWYTKDCKGFFKIWPSN